MLRSVIAVSQVALLVALFALPGERSLASNETESEAAYTQDITKRADKIVAPLGITDDSAKARVRVLIVNQYRSLREIHGARDAKIGEVKHTSAADPTIAEAWIKTARDTANLKLADVHRRFVARLTVELTPEQVDKVKDGMTYGVVSITYKRYLELFPNLKVEQKHEVLANLVEARELAMDAGSSEEKHAVFGKYKGRINNYLSAAGYDMKQAEKQISKSQNR